MRLLLIGFALTVVLLALPGESRAQDELTNVFSRLLNNPNDTALNARYAALVEARHACSVSADWTEALAKSKKFIKTG